MRRLLLSFLRWQAREAGLSPWAGRQVRRRFTADVGPADNPVADQAYWGDVRIAAGDAAVRRAPLPFTPARAMPWVNVNGVRQQGIRASCESTEVWHRRDASMFP